MTTPFYKRFLPSSAFFVLAWCFAGADVSVTDSLTATPISKAAYESRFGTPGELDEGQVVDLEPMVISPIITITEQLIEDLKRDPAQFLTEKGWRANMGYRTEFDHLLNLFNLPLVGIGREEVARTYAEYGKYNAKLRVFDTILETQKVYDRAIPESYQQQRYDLMRMRRESFVIGVGGYLVEMGK